MCECMYVSACGMCVCWYVCVTEDFTIDEQPIPVMCMLYLIYIRTHMSNNVYECFKGISNLQYILQIYMSWLLCYLFRVMSQDDYRETFYNGSSTITIHYLFIPCAVI